jgi:hypothetical protein
MTAWIAAALLAAASTAPKAPPKTPKGEAVTLRAEDLKFGPAPPSLPAGAELAVLHGDPGKKGVYAMRLKMPDGYRIPPHWHSNDEQLTILSGTFLLSMGDQFDQVTAQSLSADAYHFLPGKMHHAAAAQGEVILEIHGMGPFDIHYLNPADDPTKAPKKKVVRKP